MNRSGRRCPKRGCSMAVCAISTGTSCALPRLDASRWDTPATLIPRHCFPFRPWLLLMASTFRRWSTTVLFVSSTGQAWRFRLSRWVSNTCGPQASDPIVMFPLVFCPILLCCDAFLVRVPRRWAMALLVSMVLNMLLLLRLLLLIAVLWVRGWERCLTTIPCHEDT